MKKLIQKIVYYYSNFKGKANLKEYIYYFVLDIIIQLFIYNWKDNISSNDDSILKLFCLYIILNITFVPIQAAVTRRLNFFGLNKFWVIISLIPTINIFFKLGLLYAKPKKQ